MTTTALPRVYEIAQGQGGVYISSYGPDSDEDTPCAFVRVWHATDRERTDVDNGLLAYICDQLNSTWAEGNRPTEGYVECIVHKTGRMSCDFFKNYWELRS